MGFKNLHRLERSDCNTSGNRKSGRLRQTRKEGLALPFAFHRKMEGFEPERAARLSRKVRWIFLSARGQGRHKGTKSGRRPAAGQGPRRVNPTVSATAKGLRKKLRRPCNYSKVLKSSHSRPVVSDSHRPCTDLFRLKKRGIFGGMVGFFVGNPAGQIPGQSVRSFRGFDAGNGGRIRSHRNTSIS